MKSGIQMGPVWGVLYGAAKFFHHHNKYFMAIFDGAIDIITVLC